MASSTDSSTAVGEKVCQLYERYQVAESDAERREIAEGASAKFAWRGDPCIVGACGALTLARWRI